MPFLNAVGEHTKVICGLVVDSSNGNQNYPVPLTNVSVHGRILDMIAEVSIHQTYVNHEENPIEAIYMFPLDEDAAVCQFSAEVEGRKVQGVVKEKEEAKQQYDEAIKKRQTAFLLEENKPDIFMAKVGNLPPGAAAKIHITYITELAAEGAAVRFFLPTTIAPRYVPSTDKSQEAKDIANIKYSLTSPAPLTIEVECEMKSEIVEMVSPTHSIKDEKSGGNQKPGLYTGKVSLASKTTDMDKDFVLLVMTAEPHQPRVCAETVADGSSAAMVTLVPSFKVDDVKIELIFLIDRSGSMQGQSINQAKSALKLFLHSLPVDCYFNVVGFGSHFKSLFECSQKYSDKTLAEAKQYAEGLDGDFGGTEIHSPLKHVFDQEGIDGYLKQLMILTDGEVSNTETVIKLVRKNAYKCRVFSLGLGASASHHLVKGIARAGHGTAVFATYNEQLEKKVQQQLKNALQPALEEIAIYWGEKTSEPMAIGSKQVEVETEKTLLGYGKPKEQKCEKDEEKDVPEVKQAPYKVPPIFDGCRLVIYSLFGKEKLPTSVTITAKSPDGPLDVKLPLEKTEIYAGDIIHKLAARKLIRDLEEGISFLHSTGISEESGRIKEAVVELGCKYGLSSCYTSFIAVDEEQNQVSNSGWVLNTRSISNQLAAGWGDQEFSFMSFCANRGYSADIKVSCPAPPTPPDTPPVMLCSAPPPPHVCYDESDQILFGNAAGGKMDGSKVTSFEEMAEAIVSLPVTADDQLMMLVGLQSFDGSFKMEEPLGKLFRRDIHQIKQGATDNGIDELAWATALSVQFLQLVLLSLKESWELVVRKAKQWLSVNHQANNDAILQKAEEFVKICFSL